MDKRECKPRAFQLKACAPTNPFFLDPHLLTSGLQEGGKLQTVIHFLIVIVGKKEGPNCQMEAVVGAVDALIVMWQEN